MSIDDKRKGRGLDPRSETGISWEFFWSQGSLSCPMDRITMLHQWRAATRRERDFDKESDDLFCSRLADLRRNVCGRLGYVVGKGIWEAKC